MQGIIYIIDDIGSFADVEGVSLENVISQVRAQPEANSFLVKIRTNGGEIETGFDIYNYLRSLKLPITTRAIGGVYSIGVVIYMAGDIRQVQEGADLMIHNPMIVPERASFLEADQLETMAEDMRESESRIAKFLSKTTNNSIEAILPLMRNETFIDAAKCIELGFATEMFTPLNQVAFAYITPKLNKMSKEKKRTKNRTILQRLASALKLNLIIRTAEGDDIDFFELSDGETPTVGDVATLNGEPATGEVLGENGNTYVFDDSGTLQEVIEAGADDESDDSTDDSSAATADNDELDIDALIESMLNKVEKTIDEKIQPIVKENKRLNEILNKRESTFKALNKVVGIELDNEKSEGKKSTDADKKDNKVSAFDELKQRRKERKEKK